MTIKVAINHKTTYSFDRPVNLSPHVFRLRPAVHSRTPIKGYSLRIEPKDHFINWQQDPFGNILGRVVFPEKCRELVVEVEVIADMTVINPFDFFVEDYAEHYPFNYDENTLKELQPYLEIAEDGPLLAGWIESFDLKKRNINDFLVDVNRSVYLDISYNIRMEVGVQTCEETLLKRSGSCRDSAWLLVQIFRHLGLAARFVSGYLVQLTADIKSLDGPSGPEQDFTDLHAWTEVYIPGAGWIGLDPTSGLLAGEGHIPLACTPDPASAAPVTGAIDECEVEFAFSNTVQRLHEDPRVTRPYSDEQWYQIDALGKLVDKQLEADDVRLTMGGEPTFVSIDDMEGDQWNTLADGAHKRERAQELTKRLRDVFSKGAMLHYGQGKWYPGEPVPRWQYGIFWRKDGVDMWGDFKLRNSRSSKMGSRAAAEGGVGGAVAVVAGATEWSPRGRAVDRTRTWVWSRCSFESSFLICDSNAAISAFSVRARSEIGSGFFFSHGIFQALVLILILIYPTPRLRLSKRLRLRAVQRRESNTAIKPPNASNATKASGQVSASPSLHSSAKGFPANGVMLEVPVAASAVASLGAADKMGNFNRAPFHSIRAFSMAVRARVNSMLKLSFVQPSSWTASTFFSASPKSTIARAICSASRRELNSASCNSPKPRVSWWMTSLRPF